MNDVGVIDDALVRGRHSATRGTSNRAFIDIYRNPFDYINADKLPEIWTKLKTEKIATTLSAIDF